MISQEQIVQKIASILYDKKGMNLLAINLQGLSSIADYIVVAEGYVERHVIAMAKALEKDLSSLGVQPAFVEGKSEGSWVVLDFLGVIVHLFLPESRRFYQVESLWPEAKLVKLKIPFKPREVETIYG